MIAEIYQNISYYLNLTASTEVLWIILPLFIATVAIIIYFERYRDERPGWNTYFANSLVLLFVSIILLRYIQSINGLGAVNYVEYGGKTIVSAIVLLIGIVILLFNFEHFLPEKVARQISSPLTLNLVAYIAVLFVYSGAENAGKGAFAPEITSSWSIFLALLILFIVLIIILNLIKRLMKKIFLRLKRMKEREKVEEIKQDKKPIQEKKKEVKKEEKIIRKKKKQVKKEEKKVEKEKIRQLDKQKKEAIKLKNVVRGVKKK